MAQMDDLFILLTLVLSLTSAEAASQIIVRRGFLSKGYVDHDFFNYTANVCGISGKVNEWCKGKKGFQVVPAVAGDIPSSMCACYCAHNFKTFLPRKEKCVNISYLERHGDFGNGNYQFMHFADFTQASSIKLKMSRLNKVCNKCEVKPIQYFNKDGWKLTSQPQLIRIQPNCMLSWNSSYEELVGKILKIQLHDCQKEGLNKLPFFLKSNGSYVIDVTTPTLSTATTTISSSMDLTEMPTFSSSSTSPSAMPTPTLRTTSDQVSEFVTSLLIQVSPTKTIRASSYAWSSGGTLCPSSSSVVIDVTTPTLSTATATISSSMDLTEMPTFSSSSTSPSAMPTPGLRTTSHQVSEFVTSLHILQVSSTKTLRASSYACSSGGTLCPSSSSAAVLLPTIPPTKNNPDHQRSQSSSSTWTITAIVVACILVGGIVVLLVVLRRRNSCGRARSSRNSTKTPVADSTGNPMYGYNQGEVITLPNRLSQPQKVEDEEYDYAAVDDGHSGPQNTSKPPLYQSLMKENVRDSVYTPLNKDTTVTPVDYSYNHLKHPQYNPPRSKSDPLYNTLQPPNNDEYMEPETRISNNQQGGPEPVYNVLEGPETNPAPQDNDPVYNVLEDPTASQYPQDNDPVYNILEDPDDDYDNAPLDDNENLPASGQDNAAYSSIIDLRKAQSPSSPDYDVLEGPEGALQDSTYQPLGVRVQDDVYQPLDRTSQPIYHSLEPNDSMA